MAAENAPDSRPLDRTTTRLPAAVLDKTAIRAQAHALGFSDVRFADARAGLPGERFRQFVAEGRHADMGWLATSEADRVDPRRIFPSVRSVVVLRLDYGAPTPVFPGPGFGRVASYAWGRDYHNLIGRRLKKLQHRLALVDPAVRTYASIDSRPVWERAWAEAAGIGYSAKNGCILTPSDGSFYFIATLLLTTDLEPDPPIAPRCGACTRCVAACPTDALPGDGSVDVPRCISYLTIEEKGPIPLDLRPKFGDWVFGCDACQEVCPHVSDTRPVVPPELRPHNAWLDLEQILAAEDDWLEAVTTGTPLRRAAPHRLKRNACIVLGNQRVGRGALHLAEQHSNEVVADAARWALGRL